MFAVLGLFPGVSGFVLAASAQQHKDVVGRVPLRQPAGRKDPPKKDPTTTKPNYMQRINIKGIKVIPRVSGSGD